MHATNIDQWFSICSESVLKILTSSGLMNYMNPQHIFVTVHDAVMYIQQQKVNQRSANADWLYERTHFQPCALMIRLSSAAGETSGEHHHRLGMKQRWVMLSSFWMRVGDQNARGEIILCFNSTGDTCILTVFQQTVLYFREAVVCCSKVSRVIIKLQYYSICLTWPSRRSNFSYFTCQNSQQSSDTISFWLMSTKNAYGIFSFLWSSMLECYYSNIYSISDVWKAD